MAYQIAAVSHEWMSLSARQAYSESRHAGDIPTMKFLMLDCTSDTSSNGSMCKKPSRERAEIRS